MQSARWAGSSRQLRLHVHGDGASRALALPCDRVVWLGRDQACELVLPSKDVSRRHLSLFVRRGALFVRDHSTYGTRVNGQLIRLAVHRVDSPALLQLGPYHVEVAAPAALGVKLRARLAAARGYARMNKRWLVLLAAGSLVLLLRAAL